VAPFFSRTRCISYIHLYAVSHHLVLFNHNFIFGLGLASTSQNWPRPRPWPHSPGLGLGLGLRALASVSASIFWPRLTSLILSCLVNSGILQVFCSETDLESWNVTLIDFSPSLMPLVLRLIRADIMTTSRPCWMIYIGSVFLKLRYNLQVVRSGVQLSSWHGAAVSTRCHSTSCWSNVAPSTAVCIVIRSCGASNTSFIAWRQSLCGCWTTRMEQFTWVRHWLLVTSHPQEISQDLLFSLAF